MQGDAAWSLISGLTKEEAELYLENRRQPGFQLDHRQSDRAPFSRAGQSLWRRPIHDSRRFFHAQREIFRACRLGHQESCREGHPGISRSDLPGLHRHRGRLGRRGDCQWSGEEPRMGCSLWASAIATTTISSGLSAATAIPTRLGPRSMHSCKALRNSTPGTLITAHCHPENSAIDQYRDEGWLDLNDTYTYGIVHAMPAARLRSQTGLCRLC